MRYIVAFGILFAFALPGLSANHAVAQGIDCGKARSPTEKSICGTPGILALDHQVAGAYAAAVARQPARSGQMRQELLAWLRQRDAACAAPAGIAACLTRQLTDRLAALAPVPDQFPIPAKAILPERVPVQVDPEIPFSSTPTSAAGRLDAAVLPATRQAETLVHITASGFFTLSAQSPGGAGLQLVDMLTGPSDIAGVAGVQDGRLDVLLDTGTYKLRVFSAAAATGNVALTLSAFHDAAPPAALPQPGRTVAATLADGEQRAFWLTVAATPDKQPNVRIEAAGRSLADLRLWRDGRELTNLVADRQRIEPTSGHGMTDLLLIGHVEPGTYLVVAYGGAALKWTDNNATQPFLLRSGASPALAEGWAGGVVGPFGSEVFAWPAMSGRMRLDLPAPATATLKAGDNTAEIIQTSRAQNASVNIPPKGSGVVELRAAAGQAYTLRMITLSKQKQVSRPGTYFVTAATSGLGGDEPPPGMLLIRADIAGTAHRPTTIVANTLPHIGADRGWHARFNIRHETMMLFQADAGGAVSVRSTGADVTMLQEHVTALNLPGGIFALNVKPGPGVQGILDLIVGKPSQTPPIQAALPPDPSIPLGVHVVAREQALRLFGNEGHDVSVGLVARPSPVALAEGPLTLTLAAGATGTVPVEIAAGGDLAVSEIGVGDVAFGQTDGPGPRQAIVTVPAAGHARTVALVWRRNPATLPPIMAPAPLDRTLSLQAEETRFFDLAPNEERGFTLTVPQGGLYRIETLGRLHTRGRLATPFIANLGEADGNGTGQNMLIQSMLRAGRYRVDVQAKDGSGHVGLVATPASLREGATLLPGGSVRASLPGGTGIAFPIDIGTQAPTYRINVDGLGTAWTGRLEDADGWPVTVPGPLDGIEQALPPGHYRLVIAPDVVARKVVVRLTPLPRPIEITGHGPHDLPFNAPQTTTWREPEGRDQSREPDLWSFALAGSARVILSIGEGMAGNLHRVGDTAKPIRIVDAYDGRLEAGSYVLETTSLGRNDRLGYSVTLDSHELQPGVPRDVSLPASESFEIAQSRVVSLTSFGSLPVRAELQRDDGSVVGRYGARADDWNIAVSRFLPAGRYRLLVRSADAPDGSSVDAPGLPVYAGVQADDGVDSDSSNESDDDTPPPAHADTQKGQTDLTQGTMEPQSIETRPGTESDATPDDASSTKISLHLALPDLLPAQAAPETATLITGQGVHVLDVKQPVSGSLLVTQATSPAALVLTLERQNPSGWQMVATGEGRSPIVAAPANPDGRPWRVVVWTVDGGSEPISLAARAIVADAQAPGPVALVAVAGMPGLLGVAHVKAGTAGPLAIADRPAGLLAGGWGGHALLPVEGDTVITPAAETWLLAPATGKMTVQRKSLPVGEAVTLSLPEGLVTSLSPAIASEGHVLLWQAESGLGQPSLGGTMGLAASSALAMGRDGVVVRNASDSGALRLRLTRLEPVLLPPLTLAAPLHIVLQPGTALPITLPGGDKRLSFDLSAGTAGIAGWRASGGVIAWAGGMSLTQAVGGAWNDVLLVNTGTRAAPVTLSWLAEPAAGPLHPGGIVKRFFGAAGSFETMLDAPAGARLGVAGDAGLTVIAADGTVLRGRRLTLAGPGRAIVRHGVGAMAVWMETDTRSPWPDAKPQAISIPSHVVLSGPAMAFSLSQDQPVLLHATTTSPVLIGLKQQGRTDTPALFPAGASYHRMVAAGPAELQVYAPQDGPLSGSLDIAVEPIIPITEGLGQTVNVAPGGTAVFGFTLTEKATIGVGVRADPDQATVRLLDATGKVMGEGVAQMRTLPPGRYLIEAQVASAASPTTLRPAIVGTVVRGSGPPPDIAAGYLALVGMKLQEGTK